MKTALLLLAGLARVDITPPVGCEMAGYAQRHGVAAGVHDPLYATVLVLKSGDRSLALVTADLVSAYSPRLEAEVAKRYGITNVLLSSAHTHSGPKVEGVWWDGAQDKMIQAVGEAAGHLFPARISAGTGEVYIGHNRRRLLPDGKVEMLWRNAEKAPTSPVDPTVTVLRVDDASGVARAILVNYACHPTVLGSDNLQISADYVGALRQSVEKQFPRARLLFVLGGAGDINPYQDGQPVSDKPFEAVRTAGELLADEVGKTVRGLKGAGGRIEYTSAVHEFASRSKPAERVPVALGVGLLNSKIGLVSISGEVFVEHQIRLRDRSDCETTFFFTQTSTRGVPNAGYIPTIRATAEGGYGAVEGSNLEMGAGELLIDRAQVQLLKLMGLLKPVPDLRY